MPTSIAIYDDLYFLATGKRKHHHKFRYENEAVTFGILANSITSTDRQTYVN